MKYEKIEREIDMLEYNDITLSTAEVSSDGPIYEQITAQTASSDDLRVLPEKSLIVFQDSLGIFIH